VREIDDRAKRILVEPAPAGRVPKFEGESAPLHDHLVEEMRAVYLDDDVPAYLDTAAKAYLVEGRAEFKALGLDRESSILVDGRVYLFPWAGTRKLDTMRLALRYCDLQAEQGRIAVSVAAPDGLEPVFDAIKQLGKNSPPADALALMSETLRSAKYDYLLPEDLLRFQFANDRLDFGVLGDMSQKLTARAD
jgi:ATP-dependent helicase Lhr and Lhr-like helicase